ncbi:MAG: hypothetical protein ACTSSP_03070 [Candidatus Asgardarchaeia archaeon]
MLLNKGFLQFIHNIEYVETVIKEKIINIYKNNFNKTIVDIASQFKVSRNTIYRALEKNRIDKNLLKFDHNFFSSINSEKSAYWLGFIFADGCICDSHGTTKSLNIHLSTKDELHLKAFQKDIKSRLKIHLVKEKDKNSVYCRYYSNKLCEDLIRLGCVPRKSTILNFPDIPPLLHRHFIRGYIDGDGCICLRKNGLRKNLQIGIIGTEQFLSSLQSLFFKELNINHKKLQNKGRVKSLTINGNKQCLRLIKWLYQDSTIYLARKCII